MEPLYDRRPPPLGDPTSSVCARGPFSAPLLPGSWECFQSLGFSRGVNHRETRKRLLAQGRPCQVKTPSGQSSESENSHSHCAEGSLYVLWHFRILTRETSFPHGWKRRHTDGQLFDHGRIPPSTHEGAPCSGRRRSPSRLILLLLHPFPGAPCPPHETQETSQAGVVMPTSEPLPLACLLLRKLFPGLLASPWDAFRA